MLKLRPMARPVLPAFILFAFLSGATSSLAQQDAPMPRETRILVQKGLTALGFDAGPADGLFSPRTRAAIRDWQEAKGFNPTGYLTPEQAAALAGLGKEAVDKPGYATRGGRPPRRAPASQQVTLPPPQKPKVLYYPRCTKDSKGPCWLDISNKTECSVQVDIRHMSSVAEATWDGECESNAVHGRGTLRLKLNNGVRDELTGEMVHGIRHGYWMIRLRDDESVHEGPYADGKRHGQWTARTSDGVIFETPYVNGKEHGEQFIRLPDGSVSRRRYIHGEQQCREGEKRRSYGLCLSE